MKVRLYLLSMMIVAAACGVEGSDSTQATDPGPSTTTSTMLTYPVQLEDTPDDRPVFQGLNATDLPDSMTLVAMAKAEVPVFESPGATEPFTTLPSQTILGTTTVLTVLDGPSHGWAEVMLPIRPNDATGWIDTSEMSLYVVEGRIIIDLSERTLTYSANGQTVLETTVAIGTDRNPTPIGSFFVTDNVTLADSNSPWGPHALGLSARSETITEYNGGDGIIGIHGTNRPSSIGDAASLGCVRLPNEMITRLHELIPLGTPVEIMA